MVIENYRVDQMVRKKDEGIGIGGFEMSEEREFELRVSVEGFDDEVEF